MQTNRRLLASKIEGAKGLISLYRAPHRPHRDHGETVVVAPIFGEVAYEVLYWLPFVHQILENFRGRVIYWGRDGSEQWFRPTQFQSVERRNLFDVIDRKDFLVWQEKERELKHFKQRDRLRNDHIYSALTRSSLGDVPTPPNILLTPETMYNLVVPAIADPFGLRWRQIQRNFVHQIFNHEPFSETYELPPRFNAVRFYSKGQSLDFSDPLTRSKALEVVANFTQADLPLLDMSPPEDFQDHSSWPLGRDKAMSVWDFVPYSTEQNLSLQSFIISRCSTLITSHGGIAYLSLALGTPTVAVESPQTVIYPLHRRALRRMVKHLGAEYQGVVLT